MRMCGINKSTANRGFTLIEMMIVVAIISILAAIAIPKFADLLRKSNEGATKGNLGYLRSALGIYYGDMEGYYPTQMLILTVNAKYMSGSIPVAKVPNYHADTNSESDGTMAGFGVSVNDVGGWSYNNVSLDQNFGSLFVNCTHTDTKGTIWTSY